MNVLSPRWQYLLVGLIALSGLTWCLVRDISLTEQYPGDLRNRVVGARLQLDGQSPYFYHWKQSDSERYYDWNNNSPVAQISNVTATPFFHWLLSPLAHLPQKTIAWIWLIVVYISHAIIMYCGYSIAVTRLQKRSVLATGFIFLFTSAWTESVYNGQMYFTIAIIAMLFFMAVRNKRALSSAFIAGVLGLSLLLIKVTLALYLLPFLFLAPQYSRKYKITLAAGAFTIALFAFSGERQADYWRDYSAAVKEHINAHQGIPIATRDSAVLPLLSSIDGWKHSDIVVAHKKLNYKNQDANSNVFVFLNAITSKKISVTLLTALFTLSIALLIFLYFKTFGLREHSLYTVAIFGFLLHMTADLFSPVHRFHYYAVQWAFPLVLTASFYTPAFHRPFVIGVFLGMFLNGLPISLFPMQHTIGEYMIYGSLLGILLTYQIRRHR